VIVVVGFSAMGSDCAAELAEQAAAAVGKTVRVTVDIPIQYADMISSHLLPHRFDPKASEERTSKSKLACV